MFIDNSTDLSRIALNVFVYFTKHIWICKRITFYADLCKYFRISPVEFAFNNLLVRVCISC